MEGTRGSLLAQIMAWATNESEQMNESNTYWIYGLPGIGKTALAHSICESLYNQMHLAGAIFCRRDDSALSESRNILPTLIYKLAIIFPPFRRIVASRIRNDPNLTPGLMPSSLLLDFIRQLPHPPNRSLVFVIDALDECGDSQSRPVILKILTDAASSAPWLKVIITSRPEVDIQRFFDYAASRHLRYDLARDPETAADLRTFARREFDMVASEWHLPTPWPEESLFDAVTSRAKTVVLAIEHSRDPTESLKATLQDSAGPGLTSLYSLYSSILKSRIVHSNAEFRRMIGVVLTSAPYRALCEETIATLAGVRVNLVKKWVDDLSSLLYRDEGANGGIRVRQSSISDFFLSVDCPYDYQINIQDANMQLGIACLDMMVGELRFNICGLDDSRLANADIEDLPSRVKHRVSDPLQYSSLHWSNHLCFSPGDHDQPVLVLGKFFEGPCPLFWIEVLSIMGMVPIAAPSLRRVISWAKVGTSCLPFASRVGSNLL